MTLQATTLLLLLMTHILTAQTQPIDLSGTWNLQLDPSDQMIKTEPSKWKWNDTMTLPGTTDLAKKGPHITKSIPYNYHLNREYAYTGPAYYSRTITIPENWKNMSTQLILERVMWQSRVWIDGKEISPPQDSLNTAHKHVLGKLTPGQHQITVRIDNRMVHPIGDKGHAYGDQTQSIWNGIVGKIELRAVSDNHIDFVRVFPSNNGQLKVEVNGSGQGPLQLRAICINNGSGRAFEADIDASGHFSTTLEGRINQPQTWSEFNPKTYQVQVDLLQDGTVIDSSITRFGFREVSRDGNQLLINGKPAFMRGNLECAVFPLTGHPPVTVEGWKKVWQVYKDHNLNHARFHSWCPPKAAFVAADELGIYLQVEAPIWIDHWMTKPNKRKEMDTLGHPKGLGHNDRSIDSFALAEIRRTIDTYGNHPSFVFFAIGNELGTSNFDATGTWMRDAKKHDPRHLYAASTARTITPFCDFNATHNIPHIGWVRQKVNFGTNWDYEEKYSKASVPIISHEIGQWPVYVDWKKELPKYTGPLKPYRLMEMAEEAKKNGLYDRSEELKMASGASNRILYRDEIESFLRTPSCRGFQLLGMQDFSGQGEALVGWLDSFYDSKGTTDLKSFRHYCAPTVPLLKLPGYVYKASEKPSIDALIHHYGEQKIDKAAAIWKLTTSDGKLIDQGKIDPFSAPTGSVTPIGSFTPNMTSVTIATQATISIEIALHSLSNSYDLWIYPEIKATAQPSSVLVTSDWEGEAKPALAEGKKVLLIANQFGGPKASKQAHWFPLYWSVPFFPGQNRETIGLRISSDHPAFADFPTPSHGDWNWHRICRGAKGFDLTDVTPNTYRPIAEPVTDFHHNRRLGSIFETNVDKGKLLVCGYDISENQAKKLPEVKQLRQSLIHYTSGKQFSPQIMMATEALDKLFHDPTIKLQKLPAKFTNADLYINAAGKVGTHGQTAKWSKGRDQILRQSEGVDYKVEADGVWRDKDGSAWHGKNVKVIITPRSGVPGKVLVRFHDWNKNGRTGNISFEGKTHHLGPHTDGGWVEFPFIREDTNDGQLILKAEAATGPNLMITDIVLIPEE